MNKSIMYCTQQFSRRSRLVFTIVVCHYQFSLIYCLFIMNNLQYSVANLSVWQVSAEVLSIVEVEASVVPGHALRCDHLDAHHEG